MKRAFAIATLLIVAIIEVVPHTHADSLDLWLGDDSGAPATQHIVRCDGAHGGAAHMHPDETRRTDSCIACFREHLRATTLRTVLGAPAMLRQFLIATVRVASANATRLRQSSRAPPLAS
ncbi:MAG TPA: hypothetical protein VL284_06480 [Thermoanaerobaculia bacterium]|nr:hypothetical protein [Thermoanaerobaculia bacterium]